MDKTDLNKRCDELEKRPDTLLAGGTYVIHPQSAAEEGEISVIELWNVVWRGKFWIVGVTILFAITSVFYAVALPNKYIAEGIYALAREESMGGIGSKYGGFAAFAGINLAVEGGGDIDKAIVLVKSRPFLNAFIEKNNLAPMLLAVKSWDESLKEPIWDRDIYDPEAARWNMAGHSQNTAYKSFESLLNIKHDAATGLVAISLEYYDSKQAVSWVNLLVDELNGYFQMRDIGKARQRIEYLEQKIEGTSISTMQSVFYELIEAELKKLMLAEVGGGYLLSPVVSPSENPDRASPNRKIIVVLGSCAGLMLSTLVVFLFDCIKGRIKFL